MRTLKLSKLIGSVPPRIALYRDDEDNLMLGNIASDGRVLFSDVELFDYELDQIEIIRKNFWLFHNNLEYALSEGPLPE